MEYKVTANGTYINDFKTIQQSKSFTIEASGIPDLKEQIRNAVADFVKEQYHTFDGTITAEQVTRNTILDEKPLKMTMLLSKNIEIDI